MINIRIGFDLDGVLCEIDVGLLRVMDNILNKEARKSAEEWYYRERKPELNPILFLGKSDEFYILTSRPTRLNHITIPWIKRYYPHAIFKQVNHETLKGNSSKEVENWLKEMARKKADVINKLKLDVYFEDSPATSHWLRVFCPFTKIIHYGGRW